MTIFELVERVGGEFVRGIPRVRTPNGYVILASRNGNSYSMTEEGKALADHLERVSPAKKKARISRLSSITPDSENVDGKLG